jgi:hypothetical protein
LKIFATDRKLGWLNAHHNRQMKHVIRPFVLLLCLSGVSFFSCADEYNAWHPCSTASSTQENGADSGPQAQWDLSVSPYTHHWRYSPDHKPVRLAALERRLGQNRFCGIALFNNSFGQPSTYVYAGKRWDGVLDTPELFTKVSAGFIYGYKGKYQHKIPFNDYGIAPAVIPSLGWQFNAQESAQVMVLGTAGLLFAYGRSF